MHCRTAFTYADTLTPYGVSIRYPNELFLEERQAKEAVGFFQIKSVQYKVITPQNPSYNVKKYSEGFSLEGLY